MTERRIGDIIRAEIEGLETQVENLHESNRSLHAEIERKEEHLVSIAAQRDQAEKVVMEQMAEIERLEAYIRKSTESWERKIRALREAGKGLDELLEQLDHPMTSSRRRWREVVREVGGESPGVIQANKPFPEDQVMGYGSSI